MPFKKDNPDPKGGINSLKYHKTMMNRIANDITLSANRRFLAELIYMWMCAYGHEKDILETILLGGGFTKFKDGSGLRLSDQEDVADNNQRDSGTLEVSSNITNALRLLEEANGSDTI